jgi:hypothetical protein
MKEDYLWDKTGRDPEIEKLENALQVFRCRPAATPFADVKAEVIPFKPIVKSEFRRPRTRLSARSSFLPATAAAAACLLALVTISALIWLRFSVQPANNGGDDLAENSAPPPAAAAKVAIAPENSVAANDFKPASPEFFDDSKPIAFKNKTFKIRAPAAKKLAPNKSAAVAARNLKNSRPQTVRLTDEEKYAYSQLMLALSITGSSLKTVRDKIEGVEDKNVVNRETER